MGQRKIHEKSISRNAKQCFSFRPGEIFIRGSIADMVIEAPKKKRAPSYRALQIPRYMRLKKNFLRFLSLNLRLYRPEILPRKTSAGRRGFWRVLNFGEIHWRPKWKNSRSSHLCSFSGAPLKRLQRSIDRGTLKSRDLLPLDFY